MEKFVYVTYQFEYVNPCEVEKFAVKCNDMETAREVASERYSLEGIKYLRINKCGKLPKGTKIIDYQTYLIEEGVDKYVGK